MGLCFLKGVIFMKILLEKKELLKKLKNLYNTSEKHILSFMHSNELELLEQYISLFDQVTKIDLELGNISNNKRSLPHWNAEYGMYIPSLKSILESYNDWKLICSSEVFDNDSSIDFSKVRKNLQKSSNPLLAQKLELKIAMWEKEKSLSIAIDNATKKMFLNTSLKKILNNNRLKAKK